MPTMYALTVPAVMRSLSVLARYLDLAEAHVTAQGLDASTLIDARLAPDMLTLAGQVQRASDNAKGGVARLAGVEAPGYADDETSFPELKARLAKTVAFIEGVDPAAFEGSDLRVLTLTFRSINGDMTGFEYLTKYLLPNVDFHIATAHGILRNQGLAIGKKDYFGVA
jgi:hypothetical protein